MPSQLIMGSETTFYRTQGILFADGTEQITAATGTPTFPIEAPNGSAAAPSYSFASEPTTGIYAQTSGNPTFALSGVDTMQIAPGSVKLISTLYYSWVPDGTITTTPDTTIARTGPAAIAVGVGGNAAGSIESALLLLGGTATGISRVSSGIVGIGDGVVGDISGELQLTQISALVNIWAAGVTKTAANSAFHITSTSTQLNVPTGGTLDLAVNNAAVLTVSAGLVALTGASVNLTFGASTGISRTGPGALALGDGTAGDTTGTLTLAQTILTAVAPTVAAAQVGLGSTTATTVGAAGAASALPATPTGYLIINVAGTKQKIPYYNN
jgi:hypothetical protein